MLKELGGLVIVISAPAGAGKTTLCKRLLQDSPSFISSVSFTTRPPRKQEIEGVDYYFVTRSEFEKLAREDAFVEWAEVHTHLYGTSREFLQKNIEAGRDVVLEVDVAGGKKIKEQYSQAILIFLVPPSWPELEKRLQGRGTETGSSIERRLATAKEEIRQLHFYDYFLVNNDIASTLTDLLSIIRAERHRITRLSERELQLIEAGE